MLLVLPEDVLHVILAYTDPATQTRWEAALPSNQGARGHLRTEAMFVNRWLQWLDHYGIQHPRPFARKYKTAKQSFVRHAGRMCIGTRRDSGCWAYTTHETTFVAQAFGEPRLCKRCEFFRFVSKSRAVEELQCERRRLSRPQRDHHRQLHATLLETAAWRRVFYGKISQGVFARRRELNMGRGHVVRYISARFPFD